MYTSASTATTDGFAEEVGDNGKAPIYLPAGRTCPNTFSVFTYVGLQFHSLLEAKCQNGASKFRGKPDSCATSVCWYVRVCICGLQRGKGENCTPG